MKIKVSDLYNLSLGLNDLADKELPISTSLKVQRNQKNVSEELVSSDKVRQKIIKEHQKEKFDDGSVKLTDEGIKKIDELMQQDVDVDLQEIKINELEDISIKPSSLNLLNKILKDENAE